MTVGAAPGGGGGEDARPMWKKQVDVAGQVGEGHADAKQRRGQLDYPHMSNYTRGGA